MRARRRSLPRLGAPEAGAVAMLILAEAPQLPQLPQFVPGQRGSGAGGVVLKPRGGAADDGHGGGMLPSIHGMRQQASPPQQLHAIDAEVRQLEDQLRAKDKNAQELLGTLSDPRKSTSQSKPFHAFDPATISAARGTGLQPAELAEAARIGLTPQDLEQLIEDLAAKEFHHLEQCVALMQSTLSQDRPVCLRCCAGRPAQDDGAD